MISKANVECSLWCTCQLCSVKFSDQLLQICSVIIKNELISTSRTILTLQAAERCWHCSRQLGLAANVSHVSLYILLRHSAQALAVLASVHNLRPAVLLWRLLLPLCCCS